MPNADETSSLKIGQSGILVLVGYCVLFASWVPLGWLDHSTELTPDHMGLIKIGLLLGVLVAGLGALLIWRSVHSWPTKNRIGFTLGTMPVGFLTFSMPFISAAQIVASRIDFPPAKTHTYENQLLLISRAYQTHGKGRSWNIQTTPIWSNIDITEKDYNFMLANRSPNDKGVDPDEITSNGYFCAKVTIQRAGDAIRVMNSGRWKLPPGAIIICPVPVGGAPQF